MTLYELLWPWGALKRAKAELEDVRLGRRVWMIVCEDQDVVIQHLNARLSNAIERDPKTGRMVKRGK